MLREVLDWLEFAFVSICWLGTLGLFIATLALYFLIATGSL